MDVSNVLRFSSTLDRRYGSVCGLVERGTVTWIATDNRRLATIVRGTSDMGEGSFAVPSRDFQAAKDLCDFREAEHITIDVADGKGTLMLPGLSLFFYSRPKAILETYFAALQLKSADRSIRVKTLDLAAAVHGASTRPQWLDESSRKSFWLSVSASQGLLHAHCAWVGHPDTESLIYCTASADAAIALEHEIFMDLIDVSQQPEIQLDFGSTDDVPLRMATERGLHVLVLPNKSAIEAARPHFESVFAEILEVLPSELRRDEAGAYPLQMRSGGCAYVQLEAASTIGRVPNRIRIFTTLASEVADTREALVEINLQNINCQFSRMYVVDGNLQLETDLILEGVNQPQLRGAIEKVADLADQLGPLMRAFFGDSAVSPSKGYISSDERQEDEQLKPEAQTHDAEESQRDDRDPDSS